MNFPTVVGTQDVWDYLDSTNGQVNQVAKDYGNNPDVIPKDNVIAWEQFFYEWNDFYTTNKNTTHVFGAAGVMDMTDTYVERLKAYRDKITSILQNANRPIVSNDIAVPSYSNTNQDFGNTVTPYLVGAAAAAGLYILIKVIK